MMTRGVYYVAVGDKAQYEAGMSEKELRRHDDYPVVMALGELAKMTDKQASRYLKMQVFSRTPWDEVCYLDADTRPYTSLKPGFDILEDGWEVVITPSANQGNDLFWHIGEEEHTVTLEQIGNDEPLQLQAGIFWMVRNARTKKFMSIWQEEWSHYKDEDQAAFIRALYRVPLRVWLLSSEWNGGACIGHRWGVLR